MTHISDNKYIRIDPADDLSPPMHRFSVSIYHRMYSDTLAHVIESFNNLDLDTAKMWIDLGMFPFDIEVCQ